MKKATLVAWQSNPNLARSLAQFLGTKEGDLFMDVLRHEFRACPLPTDVVPGVDYMQVHAFRNAAREACQKVFDTIELMAVPKELKKESAEPTAGFHSQLRREPENEMPTTPPAKSTRKKK